MLFQAIHLNPNPKFTKLMRYEVELRLRQRKFFIDRESYVEPYISNQGRLNRQVGVGANSFWRLITGILLQIARIVSN